GRLASSATAQAYPAALVGLAGPAGGQPAGSSALAALPENPAALRLSDHVTQDGDEMQQAAGHDEQVPDAVPVAEAAVVGEEQDTHRVQYAAGGQPSEASATQGGEQRLDRDQHDPAHYRVDDQR